MDKYQRCEFTKNGKLYCGSVLVDCGTELLVGYYSPKYGQIFLDKSVVKIHK